MGPLVLPGISPCAVCLLRSRAEREPSWPLVVGQWRTGGRRRSGVPACDAALATIVAGATASYALSFIDSGSGGSGRSGGTADACGAGYRLRFTLPYLTADTEWFTAHPECPCGATSVGVACPPSADHDSQVTMA